MSENLSYNGSRRSNIRIGLDPIENGMVDVLPSFDSKGSLTRRTSTGLQHAQARTGRVGGPYAPDSLMTEQDMVLDLESDSNQRMSPSISTWSQAPIFHSTAYRPPTSTDNTWGELKSSSVQKSNSNHTIYVPPPLPPVTLTSSTRITGGPSPYADEAMKIRPPTSPPPPLPQAAGPSFASSSVVTQKPITQVREAEPKRVAQVAKDDDEPSVLNLDNTLTVDRYTKTTSIAAKDRASVSSFFSTLAIEPEPIPPLPSYMPMLPEPSFASGEFIIPAPVARIAPANPAWAATPNKSSSQNQKSAYEKKQEEADCFAQDLGFEIVNPSPAVSPRGNVATPAGQSRM
ncbi:hypothetical protein BGX27_001635 [Mortierella sp. AM989]|nr:hypothetical protein BGX27_001635 [Mortierella sp. AM989]